MSTAWALVIAAVAGALRVLGTLAGAILTWRRARAAGRGEVRQDLAEAELTAAREEVARRDRFLANSEQIRKNLDDLRRRADRVRTDLRGLREAAGADPSEPADPLSRGTSTPPRDHPPPGEHPTVDSEPGRGG